MVLLYWIEQVKRRIRPVGSQSQSHAAPKRQKKNLSELKKLIKERTKEAAELPEELPADNTEKYTLHKKCDCDWDKVEKENPTLDSISDSGCAQKVSTNEGIPNEENVTEELVSQKYPNSTIRSSKKTKKTVTPVRSPGCASEEQWDNGSYQESVTDSSPVSKHACKSTRKEKHNTPIKKCIRKSSMPLVSSTLGVWILVLLFIQAPCAKSIQEWPQSSCTDTSVLRQSNWTGVGNASHTICNPAIKWGLQFNNSNAFISSKKCYIYEVQALKPFKKTPVHILRMSKNAIQDHFEFMMEEESIWLYGTVLLCLTVLLLVFFGVHWFEKSSKCSSSNSTNQFKDPLKAPIEETEQAPLEGTNIFMTPVEETNRMTNVREPTTDVNDSTTTANFNIEKKINTHNYDMAEAVDNISEECFWSSSAVYPLSVGVSHTINLQSGCKSFNCCNEGEHEF